MSFAAVGAVVVGMVALLVAVVLLLFAWPGWLRAAGPGERLTAPSTPPTYPRALRAPADGTYRGTLRAPDGPLVRAHGLGGRGQARLVLAAEGLVLERRGTNDLLIEQWELRGGEERDGSLVVRWQHDGVPLETVVELDPGGDLSGWVKSLERMGRQK